MTLTANLLLIGLCVLLAVSVPAQAQDEAGPAQAEEDCPAVQVMPHDPYVLIVPECLDLPVTPGQV